MTRFYSIQLKIFCLLVFLGGNIASAYAAGFSSARITIDGLTCSMCSKGVEIAMRKLDFVADVDMDLNANLATVTFVEGKEVSFHQLSKKIRSAGFSVREMIVELDSGEITEVEGQSQQVEQSIFCMVHGEKSGETGGEEFRIIGEHFMPRKDWKKWTKVCTAELEQAASTQFPEAKEFYFVTL